MFRGNALAAGIGLTLIAGFTFATLDSLGKQLMTGLPVLLVVWARYVVHTGLAAGYLTITSGPGFWSTRRPLLHLMRGLSLLLASGFVYLALSHLPIADVTAIVFFSPVIVTLLSVIFLNEKIGIHRILGIVAGLAGVFLIIRPGFGGATLYHLLPLVGAFFNAIYLLLTRQLSDGGERIAAQFHTTAVGAVLLSFAVVFDWQTPTPFEGLLLILLGVFAAIGHQLLLRAFAHAPASLLSPYLYGQVLFAALYSRFWFGDPLKPTMIAGTLLLIASGVYIWWRENRKG